MFGCLVAGRVLQTNLVQTDETHAYFELPAAGSINHVCVFMLGTAPFPDGLGAAVHFYWPGKGFQLLGMLSNEKPSAIFRLRGTFTATDTASAAHQTFSQAGVQIPHNPNDVTAVLGLSIEPLTQIQAQLSTALVKPSSTVEKDPVWLAERIVKHMFNYISGFVGGMGGVGLESAVPMSVVAKWYESFVRKVRAGGIGFLERDE
ncbi:DUF775-domain-containing protein [Pluteus cervinus]|uniref:DUF775-domain-containing protein n=1 Tax=Pluteus cervinus TaxID=181527 RepID=A0ACD3ARQ9_9AGAR|nr:DUF775-domain-containing protein [Pluteus cervinus]